MKNLPKNSSSNVAGNCKIFLTKVFLKTLFLIPIAVGTAAFIFLPDSLIKNRIFTGTTLVAVAAMTWSCARYGWDKTYRERVIKYKAEQNKLKWTERDNGLHLVHIQRVVIAIAGLILVLITMKILSIFNLL